MSNSKTDAPYVWIDNPSALDEMLAALWDSPVIAVDTESDSLYVYFEKVCLLQFSIPDVDYLVDPLAVDVTPLGAIFVDERYEKIFHAAEYDIMCLKRDYGFAFANLFDTMIAARILGWKRYGLASILADRFKVQLNKRMQRYNWGARPLKDEALDYARLDTYYLLPLREMQLAELQARGRLEEARHAFADQTEVEPTPKVFDPDDFWRIRGARDLNPQEQAVLRQLFILRDRCAREFDRPPFKVIDNATLIRLARARPTDHKSLGQIKGLSKRMRHSQGDRLLRAIAEGLKSPRPAPRSNRNHYPGDDVLSRYEALRGWRKKVAKDRGVEPDVILSNSTLMAVAKESPRTLQSLSQIEALNAWQRQTYGEELLRVLREHS